MRWWSVVVCIVLGAAAADPDTAARSGNVTAATVTASAPGAGGAGAATLALRELLALTLRATGVPARAQDAPPACDAPDSPACLKAVLSALSSGTTTAALVTVPAESSPAAWLLRETGIEELGEAAPASRRACLATGPPARSLLHLADPALAALYRLDDGQLGRALDDDRRPGQRVTCDAAPCTNETFVPDWCATNASCATILTSGADEARIFTRVVRSHRLYATVRSLGTRLLSVATELAHRPLIACDWAPELSLAHLKADTLGPPPCLPSESCPFETRRLVKFVNIRELAHAPSAVRALVRLKLSGEEMRKLRRDAGEGYEAAARGAFEARPASASLGEVRVAVLLPNTTRREAYDARALAAAAALAEDDLGGERAPGAVRFKVETYDDGCHTAGAYKYLGDAAGTAEYGALAALAGPACAAPWADVARQAPAYRLPLLAYTPQTPAYGATNTGSSDPATRLQLLAAGDARQAAAALGALAARLGWRRVAALSEPATRALADAMRDHVQFAVHVELLDDGRDVDLEIIAKWAARASAANAAVVYLCVEDARAARAALCAARRAPGAGAAWLLCRAPPQGWLQASSEDNCTSAQLREVAAGYLTVTPEWQAEWGAGGGAAAEGARRAWEARWRAHCRRLAPPGAACDAPGASAALLYDALRLWAAALARLLARSPAAIDDLHGPAHVSSLIEDATTANFTGLTGRFEWTAAGGGAHARRSDLVLTQWDASGGARAVGRWAAGGAGGAGGAALVLDEGALRWRTADGRAPDDGGERCALQGLADALHADCRTAYVALGALLAALLVAALAAVALHCRRRAEREYRERLAALGMRPLAVKPAGLDRWEVPRERVVINRKLGTGAFGTVYGGHALLAEDRGWSAVAVKTLKAGATTDVKLDFLSEAEAMKRFDHKNVIRLLGVVTKTEPVCTVMEFMLYGDLKNYLLARRHLATGPGGGAEEEAGGGEADEASPRRLTGMALDVARALSYLAQLRYVHRDVAARNCLVSARRVVKLADFGMTRLVFENDYYRFSRKGMLPVRWMAPESLALGVFSPASDVWSLGVLLYEIVTFGSLPFQGLSNSEVLAQVKAGHTLDLPPGLKPQLEGLIKSCWQHDSKARPTASEVAAFLADAPRLLAPCLDVPLDALPLDADPPWRLPRDQAEARWVSWAAPASAATDTTYLSTDGAIPLDTDSFLP